MAFSPDYRTLPNASAATGAAIIDAGLRAYMLRVYNWMCSGLLLTGVVAYGIANTSLINAFYQPAMTASGRTVMQPTFLAMAAIFAPLAFVLVLSFGVNKMSKTAVQGVFWAFCAAMGASMAWYWAAGSREVNMTDCGRRQMGLLSNRAGRDLLPGQP